MVNNGYLGMVRQWQTLFYDGRYSNTDLHTGPPPSGKAAHPGPGPPRRGVRLSSGRVATARRRGRTIEKAMAINDVPVVIDFTVHHDAMVWPMVPAGVSNDDIAVRARHGA